MKPLGVVVPKRDPCHSEQVGGAVLGQTAGKDDGVKVEHRGGGGNGEGQTFGRALCPFGENPDGRAVLFTIIEGMWVLVTGGANKRLEPGQ